jgi:peptidyl-prolyl cis-trans isomerase A (cyclophilin A)
MSSASRAVSVVVCVAVSVLGAACRTEAVPEPPPAGQSPERAPEKAPPAATTTTTQATPSATPARRPTSAASPDPLNGKFTLADATKDIPGSGPLTASIDTSMGKVSCRLYDDKAPNTVANFIGLATGKRSWLDPSSGAWTNKPAYDGTTFHRIIKDFMIQGGDPKGNGSGEPGYTIPDEMWPGAKHDRAGLLCMANRGANTNGAQFFITESDGPSVKGLDHYNTYTIFGECTPVPTIHTIAATPTAPGDRPITPVVINSVTIARQGH